MFVTLIVAVGAFVAVISLNPAGWGAAESIRVTMVSQDRVDAVAGMSWYILEVNGSNSGKSSWHFDPLLLTLTTNGSISYRPATSYNLTKLMAQTDVLPRESVEGQVAFDLPDRQVPIALHYADPASGVELDAPAVPAPTAFASRINYNVHVNLKGSGNWVRDLTTNVVIQNTTYYLIQVTDASREDVNLWLVFFTGQTIEVNFWFEYLKQPPSPQVIKIDSLTSDDGLQIISVLPGLPFTMNGWGSQHGLVLLAKIPPGEHSGTFSFSVVLST